MIGEAMYALTAIKLAGGEETPRFEATITKDGKKIGFVSNGGTGGPCSFHFQTRQLREEFEAWIKANHPAEFEPDDLWVYKQLDEHEHRKQLLRWSKKKTVFQLDGDKPGEFRTLKVPFRGWTSPAGVYLLEHHAGNGRVFDPEKKEWITIAK
jgi:hypothetical protein